MSILRYLIFSICQVPKSIFSQFSVHHSRPASRPAASVPVFRSSRPATNRVVFCDKSCRFGSRASSTSSTMSTLSTVRATPGGPARPPVFPRRPSSPSCPSCPYRFPPLCSPARISRTRAHTSYLIPFSAPPDCTTRGPPIFTVYICLLGHCSPFFAGYIYLIYRYLQLFLKNFHFSACFFILCRLY